MKSALSLCLHENFTATFKMIASHERAHSCPMRNHTKVYYSKSSDRQPAEKFMQAKANTVFQGK